MLSEADLLAQLMGALDPGDAAWVSARAGPEDRLRAAGLAAWAGVAGASAPALRAQLGAPEELLVRDGHAVGDRITVSLDWGGPLDRARCAVFRTAAGACARIWPAPGPWPPLSRFRQRGGVAVADIVLDRPVGAQRFEFVLVHADLAADAWPEGDPRWDRLLAALRAGQLTGCAVDVDVGI